MNTIREEDQTITLLVPEPLAADSEIVGFSTPPKDCADLQPQSPKRTQA